MADGYLGGILSIRASLKRYQALVRSVLEYGSEVWGFDLWRDGEQVQLDMAKCILRCSRMTSRPVLIGELGLMSERGRRDYNKFRFWFHLINLPNSRIQKHLYLASCTKKNRVTWASEMKKVFNRYGLDNVWRNHNSVFNLDGKNNNGAQDINQHKNFWKRFITKKIMHFEEQNWLQLINDREKYPKLRTYCLFKTKLRLEDYLLTKGNPWGRQILTSLRSGTNKLMIEKGRWMGIQKEDRLCLQCDLKIAESEKHFLIACPKYEHLRVDLFTKIINVSNGKWNLTNYTDQDRFLLIINGTQDKFNLKVFTLIQNYLEKCYKLRNDYMVDERDINL